MNIQIHMHGFNRNENSWAESELRSSSCEREWEGWRTKDGIYANLKECFKQLVNGRCMKFNCLDFITKYGIQNGFESRIINNYYSTFFRYVLEHIAHISDICDRKSIKWIELRKKIETQINWKKKIEEKKRGKRNGSIELSPDIDEM